MLLAPSSGTFCALPHSTPNIGLMRGGHIVFGAYHVSVDIRVTEDHHSKSVACQIHDQELVGLNPIHSIV